MRKTNLFLVVTVLSVVSLIAVVLAGFYVLASQNSQNTGYSWDNTWGGMMGGMMGGYGNTQNQVQNSVAPYFGAAFIILIAVAIVGISGFIYFVVFPEIRTRPHSKPFITARFDQNDEITKAQSSSPYDSVVKTLTDDERKIVEVLNSHGGKYLQKYIRNEAGFSRLRTHRIVARLADRGIVSLEKTGNTNTVLLANWLK
jgi:uncharacterized membrane protein